jgi:5-carboxymethyl-2-hydroxymuconate isomerase
MPHLVILYSPSLDKHVDMGALCQDLAATMVAQRIPAPDKNAGDPVFPVAGVRVFAHAASHNAVADGRENIAFAYFNLRMAKGRSSQTQQQVGEALVACARQYFDSVLAEHSVGLTLQIDEGHEVFDGKFGNLHALFSKG